MLQKFIKVRQTNYTFLLQFCHFSQTLDRNKRARTLLHHVRHGLKDERQRSALR